VENVRVKTAKVVGGVVGGLLAVAVVLLVLARVFGFDPGPFRPGLWMRGEVVTTPVTDWTFARKVPGLTGIQTRDRFLPFIPFSIHGARFIHNGKLYIGSGYPTGRKMPEGRYWNKNIVKDPTVRIRIGGKLYDGKLVYVTDPIEHDDICREYGPNLWAPGFYIHLWRFVHEPVAS
jgi:hypothetical protein